MTKNIKTCFDCTHHKVAYYKVQNTILPIPNSAYCKPLTQCVNSLTAEECPCFKRAPLQKK